MFSPINLFGYYITMPQTNITYNTSYNRHLVNVLEELDHKWLNQNAHQYAPSPMGYRMSSFHSGAQGTFQPNIERLTGGGAPAKYVLNGNSPAYPPVNMRAAMNVSSGGAHDRFAGVDGAVGGKKGSSFFDTLGDVAKNVLPIIAKEAIPMMMAAGAPARGAVVTGARKPARGRTPHSMRTLVAGNFWDDLGSVAKEVAPYAIPLMMAAGKGGVRVRDKAIQDALVKLNGGKRKGGNFWDTLGSVAKEVAPYAIPLMMAAGRETYGGAFNLGKFIEKAGKSTQKAVGNKRDAKGRASGTRDYNTGGGLMEDLMEKMTPLAKKAKGAAVKEAKSNLPKATAAIKKALDKKMKAETGIDLSSVTGSLKGLADSKGAKAIRKVGGATSGGARNARAEIVKALMKKEGLSMIQASSAVKSRGLYKPK